MAEYSLHFFLQRYGKATHAPMKRNFKKGHIKRKIYECTNGKNEQITIDRRKKKKRKEKNTTLLCPSLS